MKNLKILAIVAMIGAGVAYAADVSRVYTKVASNTPPSAITDGFVLNYAAPGTGTPTTRLKATLAGVGDITSGRINWYRFIPDAGWTREVYLDQTIIDGGSGTAGASPGTNNMGTTLPTIEIDVTGNSQRMDAVAVNIVQGDGGTAVPVLYIQTTVR